LVGLKTRVLVALPLCRPAHF